MRKSKRAQMACTVGLGLALMGCGATVKSTKLVDPAGLKDEKPTGLPVTLSKPSFDLLVANSTDGKKRTFQLSANYVPDAGQRYGLAFDPGLFHDPDITINLVNGGLDSLSATATDHASGALLAIGTIAANAVKIGGLAALDVGGLKTTLHEALERSLKNRAKEACGIEVDVPPIGAMRTQEVALAMRDRVDEAKDDAAVKATFLYLTEDEKNCLTAIQKQSADPTPQLSSWANSEKVYLATYSADKDWMDFLDSKVRAGDITAVNEKYNTALAEAKASTRDAALTARVHLLSTARSVAAIVADARAADFIKEFVEMPPKQWRARYVTYLDGQIDSARLTLLRSPAMAATARQALRQNIDLWLQQEAETIGAVELVRREAILRNFLDGAARQPASAERRVAISQEITAGRGELEDVQKKVADRRTSVLDAAKPPQQDAVIGTFKNLRRLTAEQVKAVNEKGWNAVMGPDMPEFVVVLTEVK